MRIAIFTDTFTPQVNGVAKTFQRYTEYLEKNSIPFKIFVPETSKDDDLFSNQIHRFTSLPFFLYPECRIALPNLVHIKKQLQEFKPDIIHIATPFNIGWAGSYYGKKLNIPVVGSYHTHFDQYLKYYDLQFLSKWLWKYMRWFHRPFLKTFTPSEETKQQVIQHGIQNVHIWSRGVDCEKFHPNIDKNEVREKYKIKEKYVLSYVGRLAPEKDLDILVNISKSLPEHISKQIRWLVIGEGPMKSELENQAPDNMTFTGYQKGNSLSKLYASSDLFIFPSTTETFGNVVLEALACGTPAIGANAGGVKEIIKHNKTGFLCKPRGTDDFVTNITNLLQDPVKLKDMSYEARKEALSRSWNAIFEDLLFHYEEVIDETKKTRKFA